MESSSEDSFAWTNASCDSSDSDPMAADTYEKKHDDESESGKSYKKKLQKELFSNNDQHAVSLDGSKAKKRKIKKEDYGTPHKKHLKIEPESDAEIVKEKKYKYIETNGTHNRSQESLSDDDQYLELIVKDEQTLATPKKKKKRRHSNVSVNSDNNDLAISEHTKQKKAKKRKQESAQPNSLDTSVEDGITPGFEHVNGNNVKKKKKKYEESIDCIDNADIKIRTEIIVSDVDNVTETKLNITTNNMSEKINDKRLNRRSSTYSSMCDDTYDDSKIQKQIKMQHADELPSKSPSKHRQDHINSNMKESSAINNSLVSPHKISQRTPKISDRIRYEDDDDDDSEIDSSQSPSSERVKLSSKLKLFLNANTNLKPILLHSKINLSLTQDDELWILRCPHEINIKSFEDTNLKLDGKCKIKIEGQTYEGAADEETRRVAILTLEHSKSVIKNIPLNGTVELRKKIPKAHFPQDNIIENNQTNFIPLPETKCRHPLFGSNYKKAIKIPSVIADRLKESVEEIDHEIIVKRKKMKQKKKHNQIESPVTVSEPAIPEPEIVKKKKKKRKHTDDEEAPMKAKRIKFNPESAEAWESEKAIEENLFNF